MNPIFYIFKTVFISIYINCYNFVITIINSDNYQADQTTLCVCSWCANP